MANISPLTQKLIKDLTKSSRKKERDYFVKIERDPFMGVFKKKLVEKSKDGEIRTTRKRLVQKFLEKEIFNDQKDYQKNPKSGARLLFSEMIKVGYFPTNKVKNSRFEKISSILEKYSYLIKYSYYSNENLKKWIIPIAACELEENIWPIKRENALILYMSRSLEESLETEKIKEKKDLLLYIACRRALFDNVDFSVVGYYFLKNKYPFWEKATSNNLEEVVSLIHKEKKTIKDFSRSVALKKIIFFCENKKLIYLIISRIISQNGKESKELFSDPYKTEKEIKINYENFKKSTEREVYYTGFLVCFFVLLFNLLLFSLIYNHPSSFFGILFAPFLILLTTVTTPTPGEKNKNKAILDVVETIYKKKKQEKIDISFEKQSPSVVFTINIFYFLIFTAWMFAVEAILILIKMPNEYHFIFLFTLSLSIFIVTKARKNTKKLYIFRKKENFFGIITEGLSLPFIKIEKWITERNFSSNAIKPVVKISKNDIVDILKDSKIRLKEKKNKIYKI